MPKKLIFSFLLSFIFLFIFTANSPVAAIEKIRSLNTDVIVNYDGTVDIKETITYDFDLAERHGIYRNIPLVKENSDEKKFILDFTLKSITDGSGNNLTYVDNSTREKAILKIGDANITLTGMHTYIINYTISGALTYFEDHDEFYWNVNGTEWEVSADSVTATVTLPTEILSKDVYLKCYTGALGSTLQSCYGIKGAAHEYSFETSNYLRSGENLSIVVGFPNGVVTKLEPKEYKPSIFDDILGYIALFGFLFMYFILPLILLIIWWKKGKDPKVNPGPRAWFDIAKHVDGREMIPAEVGLITDEKIDPRDISATILSLAIKGYMVIEKTGKGKDDYKFVKKSDKDVSKLTEFEKYIYEGVFKGNKDEATLKSLENKFYTEVKKAKDFLYKNMKDKGYFENNPETTRTIYTVIGIICFFIFNFFLGILFFIFSRLMPKRTVIGVEKKEESLALKRFLESQDRQLEFQEKNWFFFEKLLPYAIAFGVAKIWAEKFKDLQIPENVTWYQGDTTGLLPVMFISNLTNFTKAAETMSGVPYSSSRSSSGFHSGFSGGGGSSGGGGGGGGGGSW